jgi:hypothetical protein
MRIAQRTRMKGGVCERGYSFRGKTSIRGKEAEIGRRRARRDARPETTASRRARLTRTPARNQLQVGRPRVVPGCVSAPIPIDHRVRGYALRVSMRLGGRRQPSRPAPGPRPHASTHRARGVAAVSVRVPRSSGRNHGSSRRSDVARPLRPPGADLLAWRSPGSCRKPTQWRDARSFCSMFPSSGSTRARGLRSAAASRPSA